MIRFLFRLIAFLALVAAVVAGTIDAMRSVSGNQLLLTPLSDAWSAANEGSLQALQRLVRTNLPPGFASGFDWVLHQPAVVVLLAVALLFYLVGYRRRSHAHPALRR